MKNDTDKILEILEPILDKAEVRLSNKQIIDVKTISDTARMGMVMLPGKEAIFNLREMPIPGNRRKHL